MAVKALGFIKSVAWGTGGMYFTVDIQILDVTDTQVYGPVSPDIADLTLKNGLKTWIQDYAATSLGVTFGMLDTVRLFYLPDLIG